MSSDRIIEVTPPDRDIQTDMRLQSPDLIGTFCGMFEWLVSLGLLGVAAITLLKRHVWRDGLHFFWDLKVYIATMEAQVAGLDPYARTTLGRFGVSSDYTVTTPPMVTWLLGLLGSPALHDQAALLLAATHLAALGATVAWSAHMFFGRGAAKLALAGAAYFGLFAGTGMVSLGAANIGTTLHALILLALGPGLLAGRWRMGLGAILVASAFKPFYLAYLLLPVAANGWSWRIAGQSAVVCGLTLAGYLGQAWVAPEAFHAWLANLVWQVMQFGDIGLNLLGIRAGAVHPWLPYVAQALAIAGLLACALLGRAQGRMRWAVLLLAALFVNPRIMPYDLAVAAVPLAFLVSGFTSLAMRPAVALPLSVGGLALLQLSSYYPGGLDPHWEFPVTVLLAVIAASVPLAPTSDASEHAA